MTSFPDFLQSHRVGTPKVEMHPPGFHAADVYEIEFSTAISAQPGAKSDRWVQLAQRVIGDETSQRVSLYVADNGKLVARGIFQESALETVVAAIDHALEAIDSSYYPEIYRLDLRERERWAEKQKDLQDRAGALKAVEKSFYGPPQRG